MSDDYSDSGSPSGTNALAWWTRGTLNDDQRQSLGLPREADGLDNVIYDQDGMLQGPWLTQAGRMRGFQNIQAAMADPNLNASQYGDQSARERMAWVGDVRNALARNNPGISRNRLADMVSQVHWQW